MVDRWLACCLVVGGCATAPRKVPSRPADVRAEAAHSTGDVILFVRDATGRSPRFASLLCEKLVAAGVRCRSLEPSSQAAAAWAADAPAAQASGAVFAVRVTVIQQSEVIDDLHEPDLIARPASGAIGRRKIDDIGGTRNEHDLRLDVTASMRRAAGETLVGRWSLSEGLLDVSGRAAETDARWASIYDEMAERLARRVTGAVARPH